MSYTELHTGRLICSSYVDESWIEENLKESDGYEYNYGDGLGEYGNVDFKTNYRNKYHRCKIEL